jgi:hypothetical protein
MLCKIDTTERVEAANDNTQDAIIINRTDKLPLSNSDLLISFKCFKVLLRANSVLAYIEPNITQALSNIAISFGSKLFIAA